MMGYLQPVGGMMRIVMMACALAWLACGAGAEVIVMTSGRVVVGEVVERTSRLITIETPDGGRTTLPRGAVSSVMEEGRFKDARTERWANVPGETRQAMMDGTYEPSPEEKFATASLRLKQSGRSYAFLSSVPRTTRAKYDFGDAVGIYQASPPPPYVSPVYGYGYGYGYASHSPYSYGYRWHPLGLGIVRGSAFGGYYGGRCR